jgi:adenine/guanine phosphoribosyltransferase-like PRPP-binding protein
MEASTFDRVSVHLVVVEFVVGDTTMPTAIVSSFSVMVDEEGAAAAAGVATRGAPAAVVVAEATAIVMDALW